MQQVRTFLLAENGWVPNNSRLPVILYLNVFERRKDIAPQEMETLFRQNGWLPRWRAGVYAYHHYHTTSHEVLGIVDGYARLVLGGPDGPEVPVRAGQVLLIPAGVGHRRVFADENFLVVGAYPGGQDWDLCKGPPVDAMRERIANLPLPDMDPVEGANGLLKHLWHT
ncbi:cupin domain-containing protein [Dyella flava]|uniref:cupin domain-containing protein n=1 Tax=Dyella flava TaxID=1920170 RepID=UPI00235BEE9E|nr:cupin domain-containing protein [Dyella flava]GLQ51949.1 hypothetical protein GCM10010872_33980 [Dyella flava]